jgi:hypothetical protein
MRLAANFTASSTNLSAEPASYPQISQTRQNFRLIAGKLTEDIPVFVKEASATQALDGAMDIVAVLRVKP